MNNDIRISCSFPEHYKTKKLIAIAGNAAPFSLISLWVYAARNKPDGFLDNMDNFDIEIASNWTGQPNQFFDALVKCKFLTVADEGYYLHDWEIHQPYASSAEERSAKARFAILARHNRDLHTKLKERGVNGLSIGEYKEYTKRIRPENDSNTKTYKNLTPSPSPSPLPYPVPLPAPEPLPFPKENNIPAGCEKAMENDLPFFANEDNSPVDQAKKPKAKKNGVVVEIPEELNTPDFLKLWQEWQEHLKEKKTKTTTSAFNKQLVKLASFGLKKALHTLSYCIEKNWQGIYEDPIYAEKERKQAEADAYCADGPSDETLAQWEREIQEAERNKCK